MSLFSRFRKAPPPSATAQPEHSAAAAPDAEPAPDAAIVAAQEEESLRTSIAAGDSQAIAHLVLDGTSTKIRQAAAEAIDDPEQIRKLIKHARGGNDKSVYKILVRKRDALNAQERELAHLNAEIEAVSAAIARHSHRAYDPLFTPTLDQLENRWHAVASRATPEVVQSTQQSVDRAREVVSQYLRDVATQAARELVAENEAAAKREKHEQEAQAAALGAEQRAKELEEKRKTEAEKREAHTQALKQIGGLLRKAHGALASGSSRTAAGMRRVIEEKLSTAPPLPPHLANQLKQLDAKLQELQDWKSFSVAPKRADLIQRMESFIGATMHPTALAGHIKDLQEQWRTLSKGAGENSEADWQRFHEAAQKAFEPCREYFAAQDQIKKQNLEQRSALFERLLAFEQRQNWDEPDWRTVLTAVREAKQLWRQHAPVDMEECAPLQAKFTELTASLQSRIDAEYARNVKQKQSLVERARSLSTSDDSRAATDEVKRLQERWKAIGPVPREEDGKLWQAFREQCDAVFQKRQQAFASQSAALDANKSQAASLIEELEGIASRSGLELLEGAKKLPELRAAFDAIEELPRANARQLQDKFERAFKRCRKAVADQQAKNAEQGWIALLDAANDARAYRLAQARAHDSNQVEELKQRTEEALSAAAHFPKRGIEALKNSLAQPGKDDIAANELALRTLCIRAEILTDSPTPETDQALRREYQVKRLVQSMGQGLKAEEGEIDDMTLEWLGVGPVEEGTYLELVARLKQCRTKSLGR